MFVRFLIPMAGLLTLASLAATNTQANSSYPTGDSASHALAVQVFATETIIAGAEPTFSAATRRRVNNCKEKWMKDIEAQAWADAGAIAKIADNWEATKIWQPAMDEYMGTDSVKSDYAYKIYAALENENKAHSGNWIFPESVIDIYCGDTNPDKKVCKPQRNPRDPNGPLVTAFASTWVSRGWFYNTYNVVLCPRFFAEKTSLVETLTQMENGSIDPANATAYKFTWGHTIYHELMHLDPVIANEEVWDVTYGACNVAKLAKQNGCAGGSWPGWNPKRGAASSLNNADSWAYFADTAYFQEALKMGSPGAPPDCDLTSTEVEPEDPEGMLYPDVDMPLSLASLSSPTAASPDQTPAPDGPTPIFPFNPSSIPSGLATPYTNAVAYFASASSVSSSSSPVSSSPVSSIPVSSIPVSSIPVSSIPVSSIPVSSSPPSSSSPGQCQGNQIEGNCTEATFPPYPPFSGPQIPVCLKVDASTNDYLRVNASQAEQAAADYCSALTQAKLVLNDNSSPPEPYHVAQAADKGGQLVLSVLYDNSSCPTDKSSSTLDFTKLSVKDCQDDFNGILAQYCAQDSSWGDYNPNYTLEGGDYLSDCGLFSLAGLPAS